jgi:hypothetical protein
MIPGLGKVSIATLLSFLSGLVDVAMLRPCLMHETLWRFAKVTKEGAVHKLLLVAKTSCLKHFNKRTSS